MIKHSITNEMDKRENKFILENESTLNQSIGIAVNLALFDFDGTVTNTDTFTKFVFLAVDKRRINMGIVLLLPYILGYKLGKVHGSVIRQKIFKFGFKGKSLQEVEKLATEYATNVITQYIRQQAMDKINWHKAQGDTVVIVSASLDLYLKPWCAEQGLELLCTEVESINGILTGNYIRFDEPSFDKHNLNKQNGDCSSAVKVQKIRSAFDLQNFDKIYAYGDTPEDNEMLALADEAFYQYF